MTDRRKVWVGCSSPGGSQGQFLIGNHPEQVCNWTPACEARSRECLYRCIDCCGHSIASIQAVFWADFHLILNSSTAGFYPSLWILHRPWFIWILHPCMWRLWVKATSICLPSNKQLKVVFPWNWTLSHPLWWQVNYSSLTWLPRRRSAFGTASNSAYPSLTHRFHQRSQVAYRETEIATDRW